MVRVLGRSSMNKAPPSPAYVAAPIKINFVRQPLIRIDTFLASSFNFSN
jgi:hypothetical protein